MVEAVGYNPEGLFPVRPLNLLVYAKLPSCSLALGSTPLADVSTTNLPGAKRTSAYKSDSLTGVIEPIV
jgi:hypothetical protein